MAAMHFPLYDTAFLGTTAGVEHNLFQSPQGSQPGLTLAVTNMRGAGFLPSTESFTVNKIRVTPDAALSRADVLTLWRNSYLILRVSDQNKLQLPLVYFVSHAGFQGVDSTTAGANQLTGGIAGDGFTLTIPIDITGGAVFRVVIGQGSAMSVANQQLRVVLDGILNA